MAKKINSDIFRVRVIPTTAFPWIRVLKHPYGIRKAGKFVGSVITQKKTREEVACEIGEVIIGESPILSRRFRSK